MRITTNVTLALCLLASPMASAQENSAAGAPIVLQTKMDANLKNILDVLASALIARVPGVSKESKVEFSVDSALDKGSVNGIFTVVVNGADAQPMINIDGQIAIGMTRANDGGAAIDVLTSGRVSSEQLISSLVIVNQSLGGAALLTADQSALSASQKSAVAFENLKQNILISLDQASTAAGPVKRTQGFGSSNQTVEPSGEASLDPETAAQLSEVVKNGFLVSSTEGQTVFTIDMNVVKGLSGDVAKVNPVLSAISAFQSIQITVGDSDALFELSTHTQVSNQVVSIYDQYLLQEQSKAGGLADLNELFSKIGVWAVGRCSSEKYQGLCVDKLLNSCAANLRHVSTCIEQAKAVQDARESGNVVSNGAAIFGQEVGQVIGDGLDATGAAIGSSATGFWNMITGNNQDTEAKPAE